MMTLPLVVTVQPKLIHKFQLDLVIGRSFDPPVTLLTVVIETNAVVAWRCDFFEAEGWQLHQTTACSYKDEKYDKLTPIVLNIC